MKKLIIENVKKSYDGKCVLDGVNIECNSRKATCIMGISGAGKTTLLNIIMRLTEPDYGKIICTGEFSTKENNYQYRVSAVFQENSLIEHLSPVVNVSMILKGKCDKAVVKAELGKLIDKEALNKPCSQYSGGMKRRVEIVRAIMAESDVVVMDEPFAGLDENTKDNGINYSMDNIGERILIGSTHDITDAKKLCADIVNVNNNI